ncbi:MAG: Hsp70 family protein [Myxococcota bacterium]|nr:Hsp70 family protein [Myxococcota bacterium]
MSIAIGIDLGTTNSSVAYVKDGKPIMIPFSDGNTVLPSLFSIDEQGNPVVGNQAKYQKNPNDLIRASKRLIGRNFHRAEEMRQLFTYELLEGSDKEILVKVQQQVFTLEEISAAILQQLRYSAQEYFAEEITQAVITVPTYFNEQQRQSIQKAGELAGLEVLRIINEPTAAALAYGYQKETYKKIAVYDFGGGTFDISVVNIQGPLFEVLASGGNPLLGGVDFDDRIVRFLLEHILDEYGYDLSIDKNALAQIRDTAEQSKIQLSTAQEVEISLSFAVEDRDAPFLFQYTFSRAKLEALTEELVLSTIQSCDRIFNESNIDSSSLDEVLLIGGQSLMPLVRTRLEDFLGYPPSNSIDPNDAVALGAAMMAHSITHKEANIHLKDVLPMSIGLRKGNGSMHILFPQGNPLPCKKICQLPTFKDNQSSIMLRLYQGENLTASENQQLNTFVFSNLRRAPKGRVKIEVLFDIDENGILNVHARDKATKKRVDIQSYRSDPNIDQLSNPHPDTETNTTTSTNPSTSPSPEPAESDLVLEETDIASLESLPNVSPVPPSSPKDFDEDLELEETDIASLESLPVKPLVPPPLAVEPATTTPVPTEMSSRLNTAAPSSVLNVEDDLGLTRDYNIEEERPSLLNRFFQWIAGIFK